MVKSLRASERVFAVLLWLVSIAFAAFLIGLGDRVIADLPRLSTEVTRDQFADRTALDAVRADDETVQRDIRDLDDNLARARLTSEHRSWPGRRHLSRHHRRSVLPGVRPQARRHPLICSGSNTWRAQLTCQFSQVAQNG